MLNLGLDRALSELQADADNSKNLATETRRFVPPASRDYSAEFERPAG